MYVYYFIDITSFNIVFQVKACNCTQKMGSVFFIHTGKTVRENIGMVLRHVASSNCRLVTNTVTNDSICNSCRL